MPNLRTFDYYNTLYSWDGGDWAVLDAERPFRSWDFDPPHTSIQERRGELVKQFPALTERAPPYFAGGIWRHQVDWPNGNAIGPWEFVTGITNPGWALSEATKAPPPPVGRPSGTAPPAGERPVPGLAAEMGAVLAPMVGGFAVGVAVGWFIGRIV